jgi:hypothetical protein
MFPKKVFFSVFFLFAFFFFAETQVFACSCGSKPTVLDQFESSELVIAPEFVAVEKIREKEKEDEYDIDYIKSVSMRVEKVYKGNVKVGDILTFAQGGADCIWTFDEDGIGDEFLFYLENPSKGHPIFDNKDNDAKPMYRAVTCGRSRGSKGTIDDLLYLDNLAKTRGRTRLSGTLGRWLSDAPSFAHIKIKITVKNKTYETKTDASGIYEIYDLPAAEYSVEPQIPAGWNCKEFQNIKTNEIKVDGDKNLPEVKLIIPFPQCAKTKEQ